jgi:SAM-dependent methyltransferase
MWNWNREAMPIIKTQAFDGRGRPSPTGPTMAINRAQLLDLLTEYRRQNWAGIQTPDWQRKIVQSIADYQEPAVLKRIAPHWQLPADPVILDLGSGVGNFVVACRNRGLRAFGVEPDRIGQSSRLTSLQIARKRLNESSLAAAVGEQLPFRDSTFDLVVLDQVIEHVADQKLVISEAWRVLKPSGTMYIACPNYLRFHEPHYKIWFFPLLPKTLGAWYLRLRGRDPVLLRQISYTTNWRLRKLLQMCDMERVIDLNCETLLAKCRATGNQPGGWKGTLVQSLARSRALGGMVLWAVPRYLRLREGGSEMLVIKRPKSDW